MHLHRSQIGVHSQLFAQAEQPLLRALPRVGVVPAGTADGAKQHRIGGSANLQRFTRQGIVARVDCTAADESLAEVDGMTEAIRHRADDANAFGDNFGPDTIAGENRDRQRVHTRAGCSDS